MKLLSGERFVVVFVIGDFVSDKLSACRLDARQADPRQAGSLSDSLSAASQR